MQRFIHSPPSNVLSAPPCYVTTTSISYSSSVTTNCSSSNSTELISTPNRSSPSTPILSLNAPSPQPSSFPSPSPSFPSPQPTLYPLSLTLADGCQPSKKRKTVVYRNKSTQTETISTKVPETCNVCLTTQERGHWVGCDRTRCGYWVHDECMGFYFSSKTVVKKNLNFYVPCTDIYMY